MAITYASVHYAENLGANGGTSGTTDTTGADLLVVALKWFGVGPPTFSDSKSNTWTGLTTYNAASSRYIRLYYCKNATVGTGHTFTATLTGGKVMLAMEGFAGSDLSAPFDVEDGAGAVFQSTIQAATGITPSVAGCAVVSAAFAQSNTGTSTVDSSFIETDDQNGFATSSEDISMAYIIQGSASAVNPTWTQDAGSSVYEGTALASFKPAAGGGGGNSISVPLATISLDAKTPTVTATAGNFISVPLATITLAANTPTVTATANNSIAVPLATITLAAQAPSVAVGGNQSVSVPLATISLNAQAPTVVATDAKSIAVPLATISLDAKTPTVTATANQFVAVPTASVTLDGFAPTVTATANNLIQVPAASITLTAIAPAVQAGGPQSIDVPLAAISITVYAPTVIATQDQPVVEQTGSPSGFVKGARVRKPKKREFGDEFPISPTMQTQAPMAPIQPVVDTARRKSNAAHLLRLFMEL